MSSHTRDVSTSSWSVGQELFRRLTFGVRQRRVIETQIADSCGGLTAAEIHRMAIIDTSISAPSKSAWIAVFAYPPPSCPHWLAEISPMPPRCWE